MFTPPDMRPAGLQSERIAIIGPPGSGKTTSLLTFPNLIIGDVDKKAPRGANVIPMWSPDWCDEVLKESRQKGRLILTVANHRDAIKKWLRENHEKFTPEQTFALDSWSFVQDFCDSQTTLEDTIGGFSKSEKSGKTDERWFWSQKLEFTREIIKYLKSMKCRVVVTFHEACDRDEKGKLNGKVRPVMQGSYKDYILGAFTDTWRMLANVPVTDKQGMIIRGPDGNPKFAPGFYWQVDGDSIIDLNTNDALTEVLGKEKVTRIQVKRDPETCVVSGGYQTILELYKKHGLLTNV